MFELRNEGGGVKGEKSLSFFSIGCLENLGRTLAGARFLHEQVGRSHISNLRQQIKILESYFVVYTVHLLYKSRLVTEKVTIFWCLRWYVHLCPVVASDWSKRQD